MIVPSAIARKHANVKPYVALVEGAVKDVLRAYADGEGFAFLGRLKGTESLAEKIETGRYASWKLLDDLYGCCLIVPTLGDEPRALEFLRERFKCETVKNRGATQKDPAIFRFDTTRFIGSVGTRLLPNASSDVLDVRFEVQIRTAFEHAWTAATHALAYKGGKVDWRRLRLAAQLKASVEQLDALITSYDGMINAIASQVWPEVEAKRRVEAFFGDLFLKNRLPGELAPSSWLRFCDNFLALVLAAKSGFVRDKIRAADEALKLIDDEMTSLTSEQIPLSISLLQFCIGALSKRQGITRPLDRYVPLLTMELRDLYPAVAKLGEGFVVD
jgi:ppGpp synthetase/RelA/SpoT-type nucleotidyltranferase